MAFFGFAKKYERPHETLRLRLEGRFNPEHRILALDAEEKSCEFDLYFSFYSIAEYFEFGHDARSLWGMNYAELWPNDSASGAVAEFQVSPIGKNDSIIPQFFKCAEMALDEFADFSPESVVFMYSPGQAKDIIERLRYGFPVPSVYSSIRPIQIRMELTWFSDQLVDIDFLDPHPDFENHFSVYNVAVDSEPELDDVENKDYARNCVPSRMRMATAQMIMPSFSLHSTGWLVSYCVSSLARYEAEDIRVKLDLADNRGT